MLELNLPTILLAACVVILALFVYQKSMYWKSRGVPSIGNIFCGDFKRALTLKENLGVSLENHYKKYKHLRFTGSFLFGRPILVVHDPEIIKEILNDIHNFGGKGLYHNEKKDPMSGTLIFLDGAPWKSMRTKLTPVFTSGKIKFMFTTMLDCISKLENFIEKERAGDSFTVINSKEVMTRLATDVTLSVAFGIENNSFENPNTEFRKIGRAIFDPSFGQAIRAMALTNMHFICDLLDVKAAPKIASDFITKAITEVIAYRENNNITRNDFMDLMIRLKNRGTLRKEEQSENEPEGHYLTTNQIIAQAYTFIIAGFETTATTLTFTLFQIAQHPEVQKRLQDECDAALNECSGDVTYETIQSLDYTEMVILESLRLNPAVTFLSRSTLRASTIPLTNGKAKIGKDITVTLSTCGLQRDPNFFPDPDRFDPERFSTENKSSIPSYVFMPFGEGPRSCIGTRFAKVLVKAALLRILSKYDIALAEGTPNKIELDPRNILPSPLVPLKLKLSPRNNSTFN